MVLIRRHDHLVVSQSIMLRLTNGFGWERADLSIMKFSQGLSPNLPSTSKQKGLSITVCGTLKNILYTVYYTVYRRIYCSTF